MQLRSTCPKTVEAESLASALYKTNSSREGGRLDEASSKTAQYPRESQNPTKCPWNLAPHRTGSQKSRVGSLASSIKASYTCASKEHVLVPCSQKQLSPATAACTLRSVRHRPGMHHPPGPCPENLDPLNPKFAEQSQQACALATIGV